jgi:hypothetical protein
MIAVRLQRSLAQDTPPAARPRARAGVEASFRVHSDELFFQGERLRFSGLGSLHGGRKWSKMQRQQQLNAWHLFLKTAGEIPSAVEILLDVKPFVFMP